MRVGVEVAVRYVLAVPLLTAAVLKLHDWISGGPVEAHLVAVAMLEGCVAFLLVIPERTPKRVVQVLCLFLLATLVVGLWRSWGAEGIEGKCRCLGNTISMRNWQQLLLSSVLMMLASYLLILDRQTRSAE